MAGSEETRPAFRARSAAQGAGERDAATARQGFSIAALAEEFAVTPRTLRFYEDRGLLRPERRGRTRIYSRRDRARLMLILRGKRLGFGLSDIKEMLDLYDIGDGQVEQLRRTWRKCRERIGILVRQRRDLEETLAELQHTCVQIEASLRRQGVEIERGAGEHGP
ncbi:MAG: MerR family DNA-binding transcriptional regulator [Alphaproteobacteria bacterium]|nr:MerR family DNA-binding transcriptional regulator [Alphaproteobacteria bacterium]